MINLSHIFSNESGELDDNQFQFLINSMGADEDINNDILGFLTQGRVSSFANGGGVTPLKRPNPNFDVNYGTIGNSSSLSHLDLEWLKSRTPETLTPFNYEGKIPVTSKDGTVNWVTREEASAMGATQLNSDIYAKFEGSGNPYSVGQGSWVGNDYKDFLFSKDNQDYNDKIHQEELNRKLAAQQKSMQMFNTLTGNTDFSVEDALYKVGESLAYSPTDDAFLDENGDLNKTTKGIASGFNVAKGIAAGGKALLGGARDVFSGFANQKRNDLIMNEYNRRQRKAMVNQNTFFGEEGGEIPIDYKQGNRDYLLEMIGPGPYTNSEEMSPALNSTPQVTVLDGKEYYIYGSGANSRMVPKDVVDGNEKSPYRDDTWRDSGYSSEYQDAIKTQARAREKDSPVNIKTLPKEEIKRIQQVLIDSGYDLGKSGADGIVGNKTKAALQSMRENDLGTYNYWINVDSDPVVRPQPVRKETTVKSNPKPKVVPTTTTRRRHSVVGGGAVIIPKEEKLRVNPKDFEIKWGNKPTKLTPEERRKFERKGGFGGGGSFAGGGASAKWEEGGEIPFLNDGRYLQFFEEGNSDQYSAMGPQDERKQLPITQEMTGEYIQQQPVQVGAIPNSEVEDGEYIRHPDGQVQQVVGRTHKEGGERLELEPKTKIISDKLKLGAKNAKQLSKEFGFDVKPNDTFAVAVEKYTKKIGLTSLNEEQEQYFEKLKKDGKTEDSQTSELNNQFLSEKINELDKKKEILEALRSSYTDYVYNLQQESKTPKVQPTENDNFMRLGGQISDAVKRFDEGGEIEALADLLRSNLNEAQLQRLIDIAKSSDKVDVEYLYGYLKGASPYEDNLPGTFSAFLKDNKLGRSYKGYDKLLKDLEAFNKDPEEYLNPKVKPTESVKPNSSNGTNTSKTLKDQPKSEVVTTSGRNSLGAWAGRTYASKVNDSQGQTSESTYGFNPSEEEQRMLDDVKLFPQLEGIEYEVSRVPGGNRILGIKRIGDVKSQQTYYNDQYEKGKKYILDNYPEGPERRELMDALYNLQFSNEGGVNQFDGKYGTFTSTRRPLELNYVSPENRKKLNDLGYTNVSQVFDKDGNPKVDFLSKDEVEKLNKVRDYGFDPLIGQVETKEEVDPTNSNNYKQPLPKTYQRPVLPDMSTEYPRAMESHLKEEHRYNLIDPIKMSPEDQLVEINRQNDAVVEQLDGLTDTQRAAALSNLSANTQRNAAQVISGIQAANAQNQFQVDQFNNQIMNREEDMRVADALNYEKTQLTAKAKTDADYDDFMEANRDIRIKRFNYLTKDRQMHDMIENFKVGADGSIQFDKSSALEMKVNAIMNNPSLSSQEKIRRVNEITKYETNTKGDAKSSNVKVSTKQNGN